MTILKIGAWRELGVHWDGHVRAVGMSGRRRVRTLIRSENGNDAQVAQDENGQMEGDVQ